MTAALLLPVVPVIVAAASGGIVAEVLPNNDHAVITLVVSYIIWGLGLVFSFFIMCIYFLRLQIHDLPPREAIVSVFLPIGPLGQGGFAIQQLGKVAIGLLPVTAAFDGAIIPNSSSSAAAASAMNGGVVLYMVGILCAFVMWGAALGWLAFAVFSISATKSFPFNMGWWGFTFPLGVFTTCTGLMATELSSPFLKVLTEVSRTAAKNPCWHSLLTRCRPLLDILRLGSASLGCYCRQDGPVGSDWRHVLCSLSERPESWDSNKSG